jgi:hypothetical protein
VKRKKRAPRTTWAYAYEPAPPQAADRLASISITAPMAVVEGGEDPTPADRPPTPDSIPPSVPKH